MRTWPLQRLLASASARHPCVSESDWLVGLRRRIFTSARQTGHCASRALERDNLVYEFAYDTHWPRRRACLEDADARRTSGDENRLGQGLRWWCSPMISRCPHRSSRLPTGRRQGFIPTRERDRRREDARHGRATHGGRSGNSVGGARRAALNDTAWRTSCGSPPTCTTARPVPARPQPVLRPRRDRPLRPADVGLRDGRGTVLWTQELNHSRL